MDFYRLITDDDNFSERWFLGAPVDHNGQEVDARIFKRGVILDVVPMNYLPVDVGGLVVEFNLAAFDMPVVTNEVASIIEGIAPNCVQRFPIDIEEYGSGYEILNITRQISCLDVERTDYIMWWLPEDNRPDLVGTPRDIGGMVLDPVKIGDAHIFRIKDWRNPLIVSEVLKNALEEHGTTGIKFRLVT